MIEHPLLGLLCIIFLIDCDASFDSRRLSASRLGVYFDVNEVLKELVNLKVD